MGYMGFGMRKEAYTHAPRKHMAYLRPLLGKAWRKGKAAPRNVGSIYKEPLKHLSAPGPRADESLLKRALIVLFGLVVGAAVTYAVVRLIVFMLDTRYTF